MKLTDKEVLIVKQLTPSGVVFNKDFLKINGTNHFIKGHKYEVSMHKKGECLFINLNKNKHSVLINEVNK